MHVYRVMPHKVKLGPLSFRCSCRDSHRTLVCDDTIAVNMLFDPELKVPDEERAGQIKAREKAKLANPFTAGSEKERKRREKEKKDELKSLCGILPSRAPMGRCPIVSPKSLRSRLDANCK